jgi:regulator of RNase E activity RraB
MHAWLRGAALCAFLSLPLTSPAQSPDDEDVEAIQELKDAGIDLSKPQTIDFAFYFTELKAAERAAPKLIAKGYKTRIQPAGGGKDYLLYARKRMLVNQATMSALRKEFEALASKVNGEYDGWGSPTSK